MTATYTSDGLVNTIADGDGHTSTYGYDGMDRVASLTYPDSSYVGYTLDPAGDLRTLRQRDGQAIGFTYDALNRIATKSPPDDSTTTYSYDNLNRLTSAAGARTVSFAYDALSHLVRQTQGIWSSNVNMISAWDSAGRRTRLTWPDGFYVTYDYDTLGEMTDLKESGTTVLATFSYDDMGRRTSLTRLSGVSTSYAYDGASELISLAHGGSTNNQSFSYGYNPSGQITGRSGSNPAYNYVPAGISQAYGVNTLNQYPSVGGTTYQYDARGNLTAGPPQSYAYDSQNRLITASGLPGASLTYLPLGQLYATSSTQQFLYDGDQIVGEYSSGALQSRYVDGPGEDEPLIWYNGSGATDRRWLLADERGSVIAWANGSGSIPSANINSYDEYGQSSGSNSGRFQYTGQAYIPEAGAYDYKARFYLPSIGRFLQPDPAGYAAGMNLYAYVDDDPINDDDPYGLAGTGCPTGDSKCVEVRAPSQTPVFGLTTVGDVQGAGGGAPNFIEGFTIVAGKSQSRGPQNKGCPGSGDSAFTNAVDATGAAHSAIYTGGAAALKQAGQAESAEMLARAGAPAAVGLMGLSEGYGAVQDHAAGMSWGRAAAIHGTGAAFSYAGGEAGAAGGFLVGEAIFPAGGGIVGAIIGGGIGGFAGDKVGQATGGAAAAALGACR